MTIEALVPAESLAAVGVGALGAYALPPPSTETEVRACPLSPIRSFYAGARLLVTGGTGFMGKLLVEKVLRSCPEVEAIYLLVRAKKGKSAATRVNEIFEDPVFELLKKEHPKFRHKIRGINGDCSLPDLGLTDSDKHILRSEVSIVFHVAATVRFDEKLKLATAINVKAPRDLLHLCYEMRYLKAVMHVSTAYANCHLTTIDEEFYTPPICSKKMIMLAETINDSLLENITPNVLDKWPNTYAFTKAVAEDVIRQDGVDLPMGMFRPAIVISTYREPITGWIDNMYGPTGVCAGAGNGVIRTLHCDSRVNANIVPADMCINALLSAAWDTARKHEQIVKRGKEKSYSDIPIYNYVSSVENPIEWGKFMDLVQTYGINYPSVQALWYYTLTLNKYFFVHWLYMFFFHYIPAILVDGLLLVLGKQPKLIKIYKKIHHFMNVISHFCTRNWEFSNGNVQKLWKSLTPEDQEEFMFDMKKLDWDDYFKFYMRGIRVFLVKDPMTTIKEARVKWRKLYWANQVIKAVLGFILLRILWFVVKTALNIL